MLEEITIREAVQFAVQIEEMGALFYGQLTQKYANDKEIAEIFKRLAEDEKIHEMIFRKLLEDLPRPLAGDPDDSQLAFLRVMTQADSFFGEEDLPARIRDIRSKKDALERAFRLEKDTWGYYQGLRDVLGEHETLQSVIETEKKHMLKVMQYLLTDAKMRGLG